MAEDERSKFAMQVAGRAESGYPKILATDDDGNLKVKLSFNPSPGSDHTASGIKFTDTAGENLVFGNLCYMKSDGKWWKANADAIATMPGLAMALATIAADADGVFLKMGFARDDTWNWTAGGALYAAPVAGGLTQTAPTVWGYIVQTIGFALTADILYFKPSLALLDATPVSGSIARAPTSGRLYTHENDADAHHSEEIPEGRGKYNTTQLLSIPGLSAPVSGATLTLTADRIYYYPIRVRTPITIDQITIEVTGAAGAGEKARGAIYEADVDWQPDARSVATAEIAIDANAVIDTAITETTLQEGRYLLAITCEGNITLRCEQYGPAWGMYIPTLGGSPSIAETYVAAAYAVLPDPGTAWDTVATQSYFKHPIWVRVKTP